MPSSTFRHRDDPGGVERIDAAISRLTEDGNTEASVAAFSDLSRQAAQHLSARWLDIDSNIRLALVRDMIVLREDLTKDFERALLVALHDPEQEIRLLAVDGLAGFEPLRVAFALVAQLRSEAAPRVREAIASALGKPEWPLQLAERDDSRIHEIKDALIDRATSDAAYVVRCESLASAAWYDDERLAGLIKALYDEGDAESRVYAIRAMGRQASRTWVPYLIEAFQSPDEELRQEAAEAAKYISDRRLLPYLLDCAVDDEREVRLAAIESLGETAGDDARQALRNLAGSEDGEIADAADRALANARLIDNVADLQA